MSTQKFKSPLHEMSETTNTQFWNDSCSIPELRYAIEYGAVGATTNPVIVGEVLKNDMPAYLDKIKELLIQYPKATEDEIGWKINEYMAMEGAKLLEGAFRKTEGKAGRISIQTNTKFYRNEEKLIEQATHFDTLAKNIIVKIPVTKAGIQAIEECTYRGVTINATVSFSVPQAIAVAEAVERGLKRREKDNLPNDFLYPVCTIMAGRIDDWLKVVVARDNIVVDPVCLEMAGVAIVKNAYRIYNEKKYKTRLLVAAYRNHHQWSEFIGGNISLTMPHKWIKLFNGSDIPVANQIENAVDPKILAQLRKHIPDFNKAYEPDGMTIDQFDSFGATQRTLLQFLQAYDYMLDIIRNVMLDN